MKDLESCLILFWEIPSKGCVKSLYMYIEKEKIPAVWKLSMIFLITPVLNYVLLSDYDDEPC